MNTKQSILVPILWICILTTSTNLLSQNQDSILAVFISNSLKNTTKVDLSPIRKLELFLQTEDKLTDDQKSLGYNKLGIFQMKYSTSEKVLKSLDKSIFFGGNNKYAASSKFCKFMFYKEKGDFDDAEKELLNGLKHYDLLPNSYEKNYGIYLAGLFYSENYYPDKGIMYYLTAYKGFEKLGNSERKIMVGKEISRLYFEMKNHTLANEFMDKCEQEAIKTKDNKSLLHIYNRKASLYNYINEPDSALIFLKKWKMILPTVKEFTNKPAYLYNLASAYQLKKQYSKAKETYLERLDLIVNKEDYSITYNELATCELELNKLTKTKTFLDSSEKYLKYNNNKLVWLKYYSTKSNYYKQKKSYLKALDFKDKYIEEYESKFEEETTKRYQIIKEKLQVKEKEEQILTLELQKLKKEGIIAEQDNEMLVTKYILSVITLLFVIALFVLFWLRQKHQNEKTVLKLKRMEDVFEGKEEIKDKISQNLHDLVISTYDGIRLKILALPNSKNSKEISNQIVENIEEVNDQIRLISHRLSPLGDKLKENQLTELIISLLSEFQHFRKIFIEVKSPLPKELDLMKESSQVNIYSILTEALSNIEKHSKATQVILSPKLENDFFFLSIKDNGIGNNGNNKKSNGIGIRNMRQRALLLNGELKHLATNEGVEILLEVPLTINLR